MGRFLQVLGLITLSHTEKLPLGRSALWLALVRAVGWRAALAGQCRTHPAESAV